MKLKFTKELIKERNEKRVLNNKMIERDNEHFCKAGMVIRIKLTKYMVIITFNSGIYLVNEKKKVRYMTWKKWSITKKEICREQFCIWDAEVKAKVIEITKKIRKDAIKNIKRTPIKKFVRTPIKKKIKRTPV